MTDTFNFRVNTDSSGDVAPVTDASKFGDGYEQEIPRGINPEVQTWVNTFSGYAAQCAPVIDFIRSHIGVAFFWKPPLGVTGYYKCRSHRISPQGGGYYVISMDFEQVYAP